MKTLKISRPFNDKKNEKIENAFWSPKYQAANQKVIQFWLTI